MTFFRKLYDGVLSWAQTPYALPGLFLLAFAEASFFPIPPDVLLMAMALSQPLAAWRYALITTIGSVTGGLLGYGIGWGLWGALEPLFYRYIPGVTEAGFSQVGQFFQTYGFWTIFAAGFTPIPYKIFTISAGVFQISLLPFLLASIVGRGLRFFLIASLFYFFGRSAREMIEKYFNIFSFVLLAAIIVVLVTLKMLT